MNPTLNRLEKWIKVFHGSILVLAGVEALLVLIIGIASNNLTDKILGNFWIVILVFLGLIYIAITILKIAYNKTFPLSIIEELTAKEDLDEAQKLISRKNAINNYISNSILLLSNCECKIPTQIESSDWKTDSDGDFLEGTKSLMSIFNSVLNILLNTTNFKFSTGVYMKGFRAFDQDYSTQKNNGIFFLRDDYELNSYKKLRDLMEDNQISGIELEIQNAIKVSLNNGKFISKKIEFTDGGNILLICANIQDLKNENNQKGVLLIITKPIEELPEDIESVLKVFTNLISHWENLYEHEVKNRQLKFLLEPKKNEINEEPLVLDKEDETQD